MVKNLIQNKVTVTIVKFDQQENESLLHPREDEVIKNVKTKFEKPDNPLQKCCCL